MKLTNVLNFHFVSVVVSRKGLSRISSTVCFLERGDNFGELGLVNNTRRRASVISKEKVGVAQNMIL